MRLALFLEVLLEYGASLFELVGRHVLVTVVHTCHGVYRGVDFAVLNAIINFVIAHHVRAERG